MKENLMYVTIPRKAPSLLRAQLVTHAYVQASLGKDVFLSEQGLLLKKPAYQLQKD